MLKKYVDAGAAFLSKGFDKKSNVAQDPSQLSLLNIGWDYVCPRKEDLMKEIIFHKFNVCKKYTYVKIHLVLRLTKIGNIKCKKS